MTPLRSILRAFWATHQASWRLSGHRIGTVRPGRRVAAYQARTARRFAVAILEPRD